MKKTVFLLATSLLITLAASAQLPNYLEGRGTPDGKTIVKTSITSLLLNTASFSGERILTKNLSAVLGISFMPSGSFPYIDELRYRTDISEELTFAKINTFSISPELRIYTGKGYGRGFYFSPYYRYERFGLSNLPINFTFDDQYGTIIFEGGINTHSAGLMIGRQWLAGKKRNIVIDWTILGAHYGISSGNFNGTYNGSTPLTEENRREMQQSIDEGFNDLPFIKAKGTINENGDADFSIDGPWAFLRGGISVGFRF